MMKIKTVALLFMIIMLITACGKNQATKSTTDLPMDTALFHSFTESAPRYVSKNKLDSILKNLSDKDNFLFTDLYPIIDTLPLIADDPFILAEKLEKLGFRKIDGGNGNFEKGPRFRYRKYEKDSLQCRIYKAYKYYEMQNDSCYNMIVYEQIECESCRTTAENPESENESPDSNPILSYTVDTKTQELQLYWKDDKGEIIQTFENLKTFVESKNKSLLFAMNAGMYQTDYSPLGLFIENKKAIHPINNASGDGNFYLKPNGIFFITTTNVPKIVNTTDFKNKGQVKYATQSGPMLVIQGKIHTAFKEESANLNIRNGVGILPDGKVIFAMSKQKINFYDFALFFQKLGCKNALYLDGSVSRTYLPEKNWVQTDGKFGVIIGVTKDTN